MQFALKQVKQKYKSKSLSIANQLAINWRDPIVSILLFMIKVQYQFLLLIVMGGVACIYFPLLAGQRVRNWLQSFDNSPCL